MSKAEIIVLNQCPWRAEMIRKPGSSRLYIKLFYHETEPHVASTRLKDTAENRERVEQLIKKINTKLALGTFVFAEAFPGASEQKKELYSKLEGYNYTPSPHAVTFRQAYVICHEERFSKMPSKTKCRDYKKALNPHILPFFGDMTFDQIDEDVVKKFFKTCYLKNGPRKGQLASRSRMENILIPLNKVWDFAVKKFKWELDSPFDDIKGYIEQITTRKSIQVDKESLNSPETVNKMRERQAEKKKRGSREVIHFSTYLKVLAEMDDFFRCCIELYTLIGLSPSEMAGLNIDSLQGDLLGIEWSITPEKELKDHQKTKTRTRYIPITKALRRVLDEALAKKPKKDHFLFSTKTGLPLNNRPIREAWYKACDKADVKRIQPYALRHCCVAYCKIMGLSEAKIYALMGHADSEMIKRVYGLDILGLEKDITAINDYFGDDFLRIL